TDTFTFAATDGAVTSTPATVTITVNSVNDAPTVIDQTPDMDEDTVLDTPIPGVLGGANDVDDDSLTAILLTDVSNGTLIFNADGSYNYTPNPNSNGTDSFTFAVTDTALTSTPATVTITVKPVN